MRPSVLVVEDHDALRCSLHEWVQAIFPWCTVLQARSGEEAVETSHTTAPAVILMDIGLPGINGIEATRRVKAVLPNVRIVMLTILESDGYRTEAAAAGACAFVAKRNMHSELLPVLGALLEPWRAPEGANRTPDGRLRDGARHV